MGKTSNEMWLVRVAQVGEWCCELVCVFEDKEKEVTNLVQNLQKELAYQKRLHEEQVSCEEA